MAVDSMAKASTQEPVGRGPLWKTPGLHLPAYIQHIANDLMGKRGMPESRAIAMAVGIVKKWAAGIPTGGMKRVHPDTQAAAAKAVAEWEAVKARAHASAHDGSEPRLALGIWDGLLHPRVPAGQPGGGKFASKGSGGGGGGKGKGRQSAAQRAAAKAAQQAQTRQVLGNLAKMSPEQRAAALAKMTDPQVKALAALAGQGNTNDPLVRALRTALADELAKRSLTGAKGPSQVKAAKSAAAKAAAARSSAAAQKRSAASSAAAQKRSAAAAARTQKQQAAAARLQAATVRRQQLTGLRQRLAVATDAATKAQLRTQIRRVLAGLPATPPAAAAAPAAFAASSVTSGDGPTVTINAGQRRGYARSGVALPDGSFPIPDRTHLRKAVKAVGRAPAHKRGKVRAHIRKRARQLGVALPDAVR